MYNNLHSLPVIKFLSADLKRYKSKELMPTFPKDVFLKPTRKSHIWHHKVPVKVEGKKGLTADLYIDPSIGDEEQGAILRMKAGLKPKLQARLCECGEESWLYMETEVMGAGKKYGCSNFSPHPISSNGSCSFYQELVKCEEIEGCQSREVTVRIWVTLVTSQREDYTMSNDEEEGYVLVSPKDGAIPLENGNI